MGGYAAQSVKDVMQEIRLDYELWEARHAGEKLAELATRVGLDKEEVRKRIAKVQREVNYTVRAQKEFEERFPDGFCPYCGADQ